MKDERKRNKYIINKHDTCYIVSAPFAIYLISISCKHKQKFFKKTINKTIIIHVHASSRNMYKVVKSAFEHVVQLVKLHSITQLEWVNNCSEMH